jgi:signal transduction histidine kinase
VSLNLLSGDTGTFDVVETFIPVYPEGSSGARAAAPYAVFAFYRDVTASVEAATASAARFRLTTVVTTMGLMFLALLVIVARGQKFTNAIRQRLAEELMMERELAEQLDTQNAKLKETNEKLREASEARSRFLSTASHELRTPLTTMLAFTDILRRNHEGTLTPRQLQQLDAVRRGGGQLKLLIEDLLDMSRIDAGTLRLEPTRFPMALVLQEVAESMSPIFADKRQRFELELPPADAYVFADRARIVQVVSNLLSNASKYTHEDASVTLRGEARDGAVYVSVKDTGIGISDEDQKHLFQLFFRADNPETRRVQGSGLGLTIVRSIVELHGGSVSVQSKRGQGSTFSFWLPVASGAGGAGHMQTSQEPADAMRPGEATPAAA